jgi:hypothetical protein
MAKWLAIGAPAVYRNARRLVDVIPVAAIVSPRRLGSRCPSLLAATGVGGIGDRVVLGDFADYPRVEATRSVAAAISMSEKHDSGVEL